MASRLVIFLDQDGEDRHQWVFIDMEVKQALNEGRGDGQALTEAVAASAATDDVVVLVPGQSVTEVSAFIPSRQERHIVRGLPYAVEDQLVEPVEKLHLARGPRQSDGVIQALAVRDELMQRWTGILAQAQVRPDMLVPDYMALPENSILLTGDRVLVRRPRTAMTFDHEVLPDLLPLSLRVDSVDDADAGTMMEGAPMQLFYDAVTVPEHVVSAVHTVLAAEGHDFQDRPVEPPGICLLAASLRSADVINLLQGVFKPKNGANQTVSGLRTLGLMAAAWLVLVLVVDVVRVIYVSDHAVSLRQDTEALYRELFPQARRVTDPRRQMEAHLRQLGASTTTDHHFLEIFGRASHALEQAGLKGFQLRNVNFNQARNDLVMEANVPGFDRVEFYKAALAGNGLQVEVTSANRDGDQVRMRLVIRSGAAT